MGLIKRKDSGIYWLDIRIKGKRVRRSLHTTNKLEALDRFGKKKEELLAEYGQGQVRFSSFCNQYLEWAWQSKPASAKREEQRLNKIQMYFNNLQIVYLSDISVYHIEQLKAWLRKEGRSKTTTNRYLQILRGLFYKAIDWEVYKGANPLKKVRFFKESPKISPLSDSKLRSVLAVAKGISQKPGSALQKNFYDLCLFALNTGMRKSEILNLKWSNIEGDTVTIKGKGDKFRTVPINKVVSKILTRHVRKNDYVFDIPNRHQPTIFKQTTRRIKKQTGIDFHFHLLRHSFSTRLLEKGVDIVTISNLLGHSKYMISIIYSHTNAERKRKAVDTIEDTGLGD